MALTIRMRQHGARGRQTFRLVVTDKKAPREGKYLEMLGWYNPFGAEDKQYFVNAERVQFWLEHGAEISEKAKALVKKMAPDVVKMLSQKKVAKVAKRRAKKQA